MISLSYYWRTAKQLRSVDRICFTVLPDCVVQVKTGPLRGGSGPKGWVLMGPSDAKSTGNVLEPFAL